MSNESQGVIKNESILRREFSYKKNPGTAEEIHLSFMLRIDVRNELEGFKELIQCAIKDIDVQLEAIKEEPKLPSKKMIVWDLETTGLDPKTSKILEIGALVVEDGEIVERKNWLLNHGVEIPSDITQITGITKNLIDAEGNDPSKCLDEFLSLIIRSDLNLTHNGMRFDIPFLCESLKQIRPGDIEVEKIIEKIYSEGIDTAVIFKAGKLGIHRGDGESFKDFTNRVMSVRAFGLKYSVGTCCDVLGVDRSQITQHRALGDVTLTLEIFKKLQYAEKDSIS